MFRSHPGKIIPALGVPLLLVSTIYVSMLITERQHLLVNAASYNLTWSITQAVTELNRFEQQVAESAIPDRHVGDDAVMLRYEILCNRMRLLRDGAAAEFADEDPERRALVLRLEQAVRDVEPLVGAACGDRGEGQHQQHGRKKSPPRPPVRDPVEPAQNDDRKSRRRQHVHRSEDASEPRQPGVFRIVSGPRWRRVGRERADRQIDAAYDEGDRRTAQP